MSEFILNAQLQADTHDIADIGLCQLLLMDDARFPWLILVPQRVELVEIHDLTPLDQTMLTFETTQISEIMKEMTGCTKINTGALGNIVRQLHIHIIARNEGDAAWPGPVWGCGKRIPYRENEATNFIQRFTDMM